MHITNWYSGKKVDGKIESFGMFSICGKFVSLQNGINDSESRYTQRYKFIQIRYCKLGSFIMQSIFLLA
jgi:hypothetical protein